MLCQAKSWGITGDTTVLMRMRCYQVVYSTTGDEERLQRGNLDAGTARG